MAKTFETYGFQNVDKNGNVKKADVKNKADLLGKKLNVLINNKAVEFTICGIVDTKIDLSRYETLKNEQEGVMSYYLSSEFDKLLTAVNHTMDILPLLNYRKSLMHTTCITCKIMDTMQISM